MKFSNLVTKQPRKKRFEQYNAHLQERGKQLHTHLSKELRKQLKKRAMRVRTGDKVLVIRGDHRKKSGKVIRVDTGKGRVFIEGLIAKKQSKSSKIREALIPIRTSNIIITELTERKTSGY